MALFGFSVNYRNGRTDYVLVAAPDRAMAESHVAVATDSDEVEAVYYVEPEALVNDQYDGVMFGTTEACC